MYALRLPRYVKRNPEDRKYYLDFKIQGIHVYEGPYANPMEACEAKVKIEHIILSTGKWRD